MLYALNKQPKYNAKIECFIDQVYIVSNNYSTSRLTNTIQHWNQSSAHHFYIDFFS